jgi:hypothetical protein
MVRASVLALAALLSGSASATVMFEDRFAENMDKWTLSDWKS